MFLVSPYIKSWGRLENEINLALKQKVDVDVIVRENRSGTGDDIAWLQKAGAVVRSVENLHAKIYLNEQSVVVSSMNMYEFSNVNSLEIALVIEDDDSQEKIRTYVDKLYELSKPIAGSRSVRERSSRQYTTEAPVAGSCIRCGIEIELDPDRPLCDRCYAIWAEYENEDYKEKYCHLCGKEKTVTYAKPLCRPCFDRLRE